MTEEVNVSGGRAKTPATSRELFGSYILARAAAVGNKLREHLSAVVRLVIEDKNEEYFVDWSSAELKIMLRSETPPACTIKLREGTLLQIAKGALNPQIALLSGKVRLEGDAALAVYFFNLIINASECRNGA